MSAAPLSGRQYALRWLVGLVAGIVSISVAVWLTYGPGGQEPLLGLREDLRTPAFGLLAWLVSAILVGAVAQTPLALLRGAALAKGWLAVLGMLAFAALVALAALAVEPLVPEPVPWVRRRSRDDANWYPTAVLTIQAGYAILALAGGMFHGGRRPAASSGQSRGRRRVLPTLTATLAAAFAIPGAIGWAILAALAAYGTARRDVPWAPGDGLPFLLPGAALGAGLIVVGLCGAIHEREARKAAAVPTDPGGCLALAAAGMGLLLIGLAGAQLGHVAHLGIVIAAAVMVFLAAPFVLAWLWRAVRQRGGSRSRRRPDPSG
ncbi:MAG TPA: hypothetical protein VFR67_25595 [Pilimelia sp.]|nr:hypothetical protein [Pilimelia sp.]